MEEDSTYTRAVSIQRLLRRFRFLVPRLRMEICQNQNLGLLFVRVCKDNGADDGEYLGALVDDDDDAIYVAGDDFDAIKERIETSLRPLLGRIRIVYNPHKTVSGYDGRIELHTIRVC